MKNCNVLAEDWKCFPWIPAWSLLLLPKKHQVTDMILTWGHKKVGHDEKEYTVNFLRNSGFWVKNANSACRSDIFKYGVCRRLRCKLWVQKMTDLPKERTKEAPPFTYFGLNVFGHFLIKERGTEIKRHGIVFTCLVRRAVHLEVCNSMETDSFIQAFRRFIGRSGNKVWQWE